MESEDDAGGEGEAEDVEEAKQQGEGTQQQGAAPLACRPRRRRPQASPGTGVAACRTCWSDRTCWWLPLFVPLPRRPPLQLRTMIMRIRQCGLRAVCLLYVPIPFRVKVRELKPPLRHP